MIMAFVFLGMLGYMALLVLAMVNFHVAAARTVIADNSFARPAGLVLLPLSFMFGSKAAKIDPEINRRRRFALLSFFGAIVFFVGMFSALFSAIDNCSAPGTFTSNVNGKQHVINCVRQPDGTLKRIEKTN